MQNRYVGDVGDFGKFALLRALAGEDIALGVLWYLNTREESNNDGKHVNYGKLREYAPALFDALSNIVRNRKRNVSEIARARILPSRTKYFERPLPSSGKTPSQQARETREEWFNDALRTLKGTQLVFLDPDNGIAGERVTKLRKSSVKYTFLDEIERCMAADRSVVIYQHQPRISLEGYIAVQRERLADKRMHPTYALSFHRGSARIYFVVAAPSHKDRLRERAQLFVRGPWGLQKCFRLHSF